MNKIDNKTTKKIKISIVLIIVTVFIIFASIVYRKASYTQTWLVCEADIAEHYHEVLKFRYDINDKLYGYYREEKLHDMSSEVLEINYQEYEQQYNDLKDELDHNFQYEVIKDDNELLVKTYICVSVYPTFFNNYINNSNITSSSNINDIKSFLEDNNYHCNVTRK